MEFLSSPLLRHRYVTWFEVGFCNLSLTFFKVWSSGKKAFRNARKSHPINQSHVCTLLGFLGTNGNTKKHELTIRSDLIMGFVASSGPVLTIEGSVNLIFFVVGIIDYH